MKNKVITLIAICALAFGLGFYFSQKKYNDLPEIPQAIGGDFTLQSAKGPVSLHDFKGQVSVLYFGFTTCPDVCPLSLTKLRSKLKDLPEEVSSKITPIFISVDWKRDTPEKVSEYASFFGDNIVGLTGSEDEINKVTRMYSAYYTFTPLKDSKIGYTVDHSSRFYIIDGNGKFIASYSDLDNDPEFVKTLEKTVRSL